jgi:uncharacterized membrane protein YfcA
VLSPALVVVEVAINVYALWWNRRAIRAVLPRVAPLAAGLVPGVIAGALLLGHIAPKSVKLAVYLALLPLILLQAAGKRLRVRRERSASVPLGTGVGVLYGLTTISGPPLALFWNNQGLARDELKAAFAVVRSIESVCALAAYAWLGLFTHPSTGLLPWIVPGVVIGFPLGHALIRKVGVETFRRICMSFDAWLVAFGLSHTLAATGVAPGVAYQLLVATLIIDGHLLHRFFRPTAPATLEVAA